MITMENSMNDKSNSSKYNIPDDKSSSSGKRIRNAGTNQMREVKNENHMKNANSPRASGKGRFSKSRANN